MQENNKSGIIDVTSSLTLQEEFEEVFEPIQAKKCARVYEGLITTLEDGMFERMSEIEKKFENSMSRNTMINIVGIATPIMFGFAGVILAIILK